MPAFEEDTPAVVEVGQRLVVGLVVVKLKSQHGIAKRIRPELTIDADIAGDASAPAVCAMKSTKRVSTASGNRLNITS